jgi:hypothetical protein
MSELKYDSEGQNALRIEHEDEQRMRATLGASYDQVVSGAKAAADAEHVDLGVFAALRTHWKATLFSMGLSFALVMEG